MTDGRIGIVGAGSIGQALGSLLLASGASVTYFDAEKSKSQVDSLRELSDVSDYIFLCIPSWATGEVVDGLVKHLRPHQIIISLAKGALEGFMTMDKLLAHKLAKLPVNFGILAGPMLADEMLSGFASYGLLALVQNTGAHYLVNKFASKKLYLQYEANVHAVAVCSALKNIYALGFGIHDGLGLKANSKGALAVCTMSEMSNIAAKLGAERHMVQGLAGLGDLLATGWSENSYNHRIGKALAAGAKPDGVNGEGVMSLRHIGAVVKYEDYPILDRLSHIVINGAPAETFCEIISA